MKACVLFYVRMLSIHCNSSAKFNTYTAIYWWVCYLLGKQVTKKHTNSTSWSEGRLLWMTPGVVQENVSIKVNVGNTQHTLHPPPAKFCRINICTGIVNERVIFLEKHVTKSYINSTSWSVGHFFEDEYMSCPEICFLRALDCCCVQRLQCHCCYISKVQFTSLRFYTYTIVMEWLSEVKIKLLMSNNMKCFEI